MLVTKEDIIKVSKKVKMDTVFLLEGEMMQKMTFAGIEEALYYEKLDNGLEVYMVPKTNKNNCFVTYTTRYGSIHTEFIPIEQKYKAFSIWYCSLS